MKRPEFLETQLLIMLKLDSLVLMKETDCLLLSLRYQIILGQRSHSYSGAFGVIGSHR